MGEDQKHLEEKYDLKGGVVLKQLRVLLIVLVILTVSGCSIFTSEDEVTVKTKEPTKTEDGLLTHTTASEDLAGILQQKPGKYPEDDDDFWGTLPKEAVKELETLRPNLPANIAFNQLIYLFGRDYKSLQYRLANIDTDIPVSESRKKEKPKKETLKVNIVLVVDAGQEMSQKISGTQRTKMDLLKLQLKNSLKKLHEKKELGIEYYVKLNTYGGIVGKITPLIPLDQMETQLFPDIDEIQPGGPSNLTKELKQVKSDLSTQTAGNVLNQIFVISAGKDGLEGTPKKEAYEILHSDVQGHVNVIDYGVKDPKKKLELQVIADRGLGEYIVSNPEVDQPFNFADQTNFNKDGYKPREYLVVKNMSWPERMAELRSEQIEAIDTLYMNEYEQLKNAANRLKMNDTERKFLLEKIERRKDILSNYFDEKVNEKKIYLSSHKKTLGIE